MLSSSSSPSLCCDSSLPRRHQRDSLFFSLCNMREGLKTMLGPRLGSTDLKQPWSSTNDIQQDTAECFQPLRPCGHNLDATQRPSDRFVLPWIISPRTKGIERRAWASPSRGLLCDLSAK